MHFRQLPVLIAVLITGFAGVAVAQTVDGPGPVGGDVVVVEPRTELQRVLVVDIVLDEIEAAVPSGAVDGFEEIASAAPKVFAPQGGEWRVDLESTPPRSFFVSDPRWLEAEPDPETGRHTSVRSQEPAWKLLIPLYVDGEELRFDRATVVHVASNQTIVQIDR